MICRNLIICILTVAMMPTAIQAAGGEGRQQGQQATIESDASLFTSDKSRTDSENMLLAQNRRSTVHENVDESNESLLQPMFGDEMSPYIVRGQSRRAYRATAARFGWWGVNTSGSLQKVGEYQGLDSSSPFFDLDGIYSDGSKTTDFYLTAPESESTQVGLHHYRGPGLTVDVEYQRFIHRLDHDPLDNFLGVFPSQPKFDGEGGTLTNPGSLNRYMSSQDLNADEDYAIRIQEFEANFKGSLTENVGWKLNLWGMRKQGERQAINMSHCFDSDYVNTNQLGGVTPAAPGFVGVATHPAIPAGSRACHALSQRQRIDWLTLEIEPGIAIKAGPVSIEYSRVMRSFNQNDQFVTRNHTTNAVNRSIGAVGDGVLPVGGTADGSVVGYAVVPENFFEMDKLKIRSDLTENTEFYGYLYNGNANNRNRGTNQRISGFDLRLTNRSLDDVTVTGYAKRHNNTGTMPTSFAVDGTEVVPAGQADAGLNRIVPPWGFHETSAGIEAAWYGMGPLSLDGGYEYSNDYREYTTHLTTHPDQVFTQPSTITHRLELAARWRFSRRLHSYVRYTREWIKDPMFAAHEPNGETNTSLPTDVDLVRFGGTWTPSHNFLCNAWIGIESRSNTSNRGNFTENDYPIVLTTWYAPTHRLSFSGGLGFYSNWINQGITLGDQTDRWVDKGSYWRHYIPAETTRWNYGGRSFVVNLGSTYDYSQRLTFVGNLEFMRSHNSFTSPSPDSYALGGDGTFVVNPDWSSLSGLSDVIVETTRLSAGIDYLLREGVSCYFRYNYFNYADKAGNGNSGTANMFLTGVSAVY